MDRILRPLTLGMAILLPFMSLTFSITSLFWNLIAIPVILCGFGALLLWAESRAISREQTKAGVHCLLSRRLQQTMCERKVEQCERKLKHKNQHFQDVA